MGAWLKQDKFGQWLIGACVIFYGLFCVELVNNAWEVDFASGVAVIGFVLAGGEVLERYFKWRTARLCAVDRNPFAVRGHRIIFLVNIIAFAALLGVNQFHQMPLWFVALTAIEALAGLVWMQTRSSRLPAQKSL